MKRVFAILIALLHFAATTGATVYVHHCMGKEVGATIAAVSGEDGHFCAHCGMQKKQGGNGCCKDELRIVKSDVDGTLAKTIVALTGVQALLPAPVTYVAQKRALLFTAEEPVRPAIHGSPPRSNLPIYLAIRSLRI